MDINCIDWIKVSEAALGGLITLIVSLTTVFFHNRITRWGEKDREMKLVELGVLRGKAIVIRNDGEVKALTGQQLDEWVASAEKAEQAMVDKAKEVTDIDGRLMEWQDRVPGLPYSYIQDPKQQSALRNLSGAIIRAEMLLNKYRF